VSHRGASLSCAECRNLLGGFVLGALDPEEATEVRLHLASCQRCASEHAELAAMPGMLDTAAGIETTPAAPPAALEEAVVHEFVSERRPPEHRRSWLRRTLMRPLPAAATAAAAAVALTLLISAGLGGGAKQAENRYVASLRGLPPVPGAHATARLASFSAGTRVDLSVNGLTPAPDAVYELWCIRDDGTKMSAGTFRVDSSGRAIVHLTTAARLGDYHRLSVERTAPRGAGTRVMAGQVAY